MERRLFLILLALTAIMMVGCDENMKDKPNNVMFVKGNEYNVEVIDSCEYIISYLSGGFPTGSFLVHKGNCKYCQERMRKMIKEVKNDNSRH